MKILVVLQFFAPKFGGTIDVLYNLSKELSKRGHEITVITTDFGYDKDYAKELEKEGVKIIPFKCVFDFASFLYSPAMDNWLKFNIQKYDLVHLHNFRSYQNNVVHKYSKRYEIPYILQAHGTVLPFFQKQTLKRIYDNIWGYKLLEDAYKIIALTNTESEKYQKMRVPEDKIEIIPNGINLSEYQDLPKRGKFREKYNIKNEEKVILYLGRLHKIKGIDLLIKAFSKVSKESNNVKLVIVGPDDGFLSYLKEMTNDLKLLDKIIFAGPLYNKDKLNAYVDADVYVLPSISEAFPMTVLESMACGTPVIITKNCGISDLGKQIGYVIDYDEKQLKNALINSIRNETPQKSLMRRELVKEKFSLDKTCDKLEIVYKSIKERSNEKI